MPQWTANRPRDSGICGRAAAWTLEAWGRANCDVYLDVTCTAWAHYTSLALCPPTHPCGASIHGPSYQNVCRPWEKSQAYRSTLLTCYAEMLIFQTTRSKKTKCAANTRRVPSHLNGNLPLGGGRRCARSWIIRLAKSEFHTRGRRVGRRHKCPAPPAIHK